MTALRCLSVLYIPYFMFSDQSKPCGQCHSGKYYSSELAPCIPLEIILSKDQFHHTPLGSCLPPCCQNCRSILGIPQFSKPLHASRISILERNSFSAQVSCNFKSLSQGRSKCPKKKFHSPSHKILSMVRILTSRSSQTDSVTNKKAVGHQNTIIVPEYQLILISHNFSVIKRGWSGRNSVKNPHVRTFRIHTR